MSNHKTPAPKPNAPQAPATAVTPPAAPKPQPEPAEAPAAPENAQQTPPSREPSSPADVAAVVPPPPAALKSEPPFLAAYVGDAAEVSHRGHHFPRNIDVPVSPEVWARLERHPMFRVSRGDGDV